MHRTLTALACSQQPACLLSREGQGERGRAQPLEALSIEQRLDVCGWGSRCRRSRATVQLRAAICDRQWRCSERRCASIDRSGLVASLQSTRPVLCRVWVLEAESAWLTDCSRRCLQHYLYHITVSFTAQESAGSTSRDTASHLSAECSAVQRVPATMWTVQTLQNTTDSNYATSRDVSVSIRASLSERSTAVATTKMAAVLITATARSMRPTKRQPNGAPHITPVTYKAQSVDKQAQMSVL